VANKQEYRERVKLAVEHLHKCSVVHFATVPVHDRFNDKTVWHGEVEVFDLSGHPKAKCCYAWSHREGLNDEGERFVTVLAIPPVLSPESAVKAAIMRDVRNK
jgi:hypothetical protein